MDKIFLLFPQKKFTIKSKKPAQEKMYKIEYESTAAKVINPLIRLRNFKFRRARIKNSTFHYFSYTSMYSIIRHRINQAGC